MLALMVMAGRSLRTRALLMTGAALIAFVVGLTRLYLAAHWMTDVLAGWALAGVWGCLLIITYLLAQQAATATTEREARPAARPGAARPGEGARGPLPADRTAPADDRPVSSCSRPERAIGCSGN